MEPQNYRIYDHDTDSWKNNFPVELPNRPGFNTGKAIQVRINQFKVTKWPENDIYQYDVSYPTPKWTWTSWADISKINIGNGAEKKGKIMAVWYSKAVQNKLRQYPSPFLWDGNKIAWYVCFLKV